jgi:hypothetical protein
MAGKRVTIAQLAGDPDYPFTEPSIRWLVFNAQTNGLASAGAVTRVGRRVYINVEAFDRWLEAQSVQASAA